MSIKLIGRALVRGIIKYSPILCAGIGTTFTVKAIAKSGKQIPIYVEKIEKAIAAKGCDLSFREKFNIGRRTLGKTVLCAAIGVGSFLAGVFINQKRACVATSMLALASEKLIDHKAATKEVIREVIKDKDQAEKVEKRIEQKAVENSNKRETEKAEHKKHKSRNKTVVTPEGKEKFKLGDLGIEFFGTMNDVNSTINDVNSTLMESNEVTVNEILVGLDEDEIHLANLGWRFSETGLVRTKIGYGPSKTGGSCTIIYFDPAPYTL